jgi:hypothetical protein
MVLKRLGFNQKVLDRWGDEIDAGACLPLYIVLAVANLRHRDEK